MVFLNCIKAYAILLLPRLQLLDVIYISDFLAVFSILNLSKSVLNSESIVIVAIFEVFDGF